MRSEVVFIYVWTRLEEKIRGICVIQDERDVWNFLSGLAIHIDFILLNNFCMSTIVYIIYFFRGI